MNLKVVKRLIATTALRQENHKMRPTEIKAASSILPSWWTNVSIGSPDSIHGITEAFMRDDKPNKLNLGVGIYRDCKGLPFVLPSVKMAEERLKLRCLDKEYEPITGCPEFCRLCAMLALGNLSETVKNGMVATAQTVSGTGALSLGAKFLARFFPGNKLIYLPNPSWGNHAPLFQQAGLSVDYYSYYNTKTHRFDFPGAMDDIKKIPERSIILFQTSAHNPTGVDPKPSKWVEIAKAVEERKLLAFFDTAYQGFATGDLSYDAFPVRHFVNNGHKVIISQTFSKNMGLYGERVGALMIVTGSIEETEAVLSQLKILIRSNYSSPPLNGSRIATEVLSSPVLKGQWMQDMVGMSSRIAEIRKLLQSSLFKEGSIRNWNPIVEQIGMFYYSGLKSEQVHQLKKDFGVYIPFDGRICLAGVNADNVEYLAKSIHEVTK